MNETPLDTKPEVPAQKWATTKRVGEHAAMKMFSARWFCVIGAVYVWAYLNVVGLHDQDLKIAILTLDSGLIGAIVKSYFDQTEKKKEEP